MNNDNAPVLRKKRISKLPRWAGIAILVACLTFSVWYGVFRAVKSGGERLDAIFADGVDGDGFSISSDLEMVASQAYNLASIAQKTLGDDSQSVKLVTDGVNALRESLSGGDVSLTFERYTDLRNAVEQLYADYKASGDEQSRATLAAQCYTEIKSRASTISGDGYNDAVREFNSGLDTFPAGIFVRLFGMERGQLFS